MTPSASTSSRRSRLSRATGRTGELTSVPVAGRAAADPTPDGASDGPGLVLLVGVGEATPTDFRRAGAALARATKDRGNVVTSLAAIAPDEGLGAFVVGAMLGSFAFHWRSNGPKERPVARIVLAGVDDDGADDELARAIAHGGAGWRSRTLATVPANLKTPAWLAEQAVEVGEDAGLEVQVWDDARLEAEGFGGIRAVGGGSVNEPRLIRMDYTPRGATKRMPTVVLVGKGITFDTGGLDIKPSEGMLTMKRDMSGGGAVIATMAALRDVDCPVRVVGLVPAAENAVSGSAMRPGDVITHFGGRTSEVNNTDAEGRLVLADAMAYAVAELAPAVLVDIATLTGAMKVVARPVDRRLLRQPRGPGRPGAGRIGRVGREHLADAAGRRLRGQGRLQHRRRRQRCRRRRRDHGRPLPPALRRRRAVGPHRLRLRRRVADRPLRVDRRPQRLRVRACC